MKKLFVLSIAMFLVVFTNAQTVGLKYSGREILGFWPALTGIDPNATYLYDGSQVICQTCQVIQNNNPAPVVNLNPVVNVSTVDKEIELQKLQLQQLELQLQADYNKKALRQQKVANAFNGISTFGNLALGTSNQVALWNGKYQSNTNVQTDVWNISNPTAPRPTDWNTTTPTTTNPTAPRPTDWYPVNGSTTAPPPVNTGWNTGTTTTTTTTPSDGQPVFIPNW